MEWNMYARVLASFKFLCWPYKRFNTHTNRINYVELIFLPPQQPIPFVFLLRLPAKCRGNCKNWLLLPVLALLLQFRTWGRQFGWMSWTRNGS